MKKETEPAESESAKKPDGLVRAGRKKGKILLFVTAGMVICFLLFAADMAKKDVKGKKEDLPVEEKKDDGMEKLYKVDLTTEKGPVPDALVMAEFIKVTDGGHILVRLDGDEVVTDFAGVLAADCVDGMPVEYKKAAAEQTVEILGGTDTVYLDIAGRNEDGSYTAYVYDSGDVDTAGRNDFKNHCINAALIRGGYSGTVRGSRTDYSSWMQEELESAQNAVRGVWGERISYELYGYPVPEGLQE